MKPIPFIMDDKTIYKPDDIIMVLKKSINKSMLKGNNKKIYYYNVPCAFDIETSSFYRDGDETYTFEQKQMILKSDSSFKPEKVAIMYVWQLAINGNVIIGRSWIEFFNMLSTITDYLKLDNEHRLIIYVHNLAFEFQFMLKWQHWTKVFAVDNRKPLYAINDGGIEFRCSYLLSGYSLANLSNQLHKYKIKKLVGELDYSLIRHSKTPLSDTELAYCINDVLVVSAYIQELIEQELLITKLPLTNTGFVRRYCRKNCLYTKDHKRKWQYIKLIKKLIIPTIEEFKMVHDSFAGGFTHANPFYSGINLHNVSSYDFTSSYPSVMLSEKFPMSKGVIAPELQDYRCRAGDDLLKEHMDKYLSVFTVSFINIRSRVVFEHYISAAKCLKIGIIDNRPVYDNGRLVTADAITITITSIDYSIIEKFYEWDEMVIHRYYDYYPQYLPIDLVNCIIKLYEDKTVLKGVLGEEINYMRSKGMLNSIYGMSVTNPIRDEYTVNESSDWFVNPINDNHDLAQEMLDKHNDSNNRFLYYLWGVFVTAYARRNLFTGIYAIGNDYVYSDTDSIKLLNRNEHLEYFENYNQMLLLKLNEAASYHEIDLSKFSPITKEGEMKTIGLWDYEGTYRTFKTLGAKRYIVEEYDSNDNPHAIRIDGDWYPFSITVSGINKFVAVPYMYDVCKGDLTKVFDMFNDSMHIPENKTGKLIHTYIDDVRSGVVVDYNGEPCNYLELSAVHLEPTSYDLSIGKQYANYLMGLRDEIL